MNRPTSKLVVDNYSIWLEKYYDHLVNTHIIAMKIAPKLKFETWCEFVYGMSN